MLTKRIIACLDVRSGRVVKGVQFVDIIDAGDPAELAARHAAAGADEIVLLDITATHEGRGTLLDTVKRTAAQLFVPFTVGGGVRSADDAAAVFDAGADKVSINSAAIARPALIGEIGASFGAQAVIVAIDARRAAPSADDETSSVTDAEVYVSGGRKPTGLRVLDWAREAEQRGAGEILLTSMDTDGMRAGFDCELTAAVSAAVQIPVIASGGAGSAAHFADVFGRGRADAALAASIFHFGVTDSRALKAELQLAGISVRLPMLIPSIDLMGGRIVQLVQGEKLKLAFDDFDYWIERFKKYPLVQLIDLDAALRQGDNRALIEMIAKRLPCQVGGGLRTAEDGQRLLDAGARRVIFGSSLFGPAEDPAEKRRHKLIKLEFAESLSKALGEDALCFSVDTKAGKVAVRGWKDSVDLSPEEAITWLEDSCAAFLYTHVDTEGTMSGFPLEVAAILRASTAKQLIVAGGIKATSEVDALDQMGVDAVAGMAVYSGTMNA